MLLQSGFTDSKLVAVIVMYACGGTSRYNEPQWVNSTAACISMAWYRYRELGVGQHQHIGKTVNVGHCESRSNPGCCVHDSAHETWASRCVRSQSVSRTEDLGWSQAGDARHESPLAPTRDKRTHIISALTSSDNTLARGALVCPRNGGCLLEDGRKCSGEGPMHY